MSTPFVETDCTFTFEGRTFESGGSWLIPDKNGHLVGLLYAYEGEGCVGTWHGDKKYPARFGRTWKSNMGDTRQHVVAKIEGRTFSGTYYKSGSDIVRLREVASV
jgi:hypothetical protein